jgi:hypothetical protein
MRREERREREKRFERKRKREVKSFFLEVNKALSVVFHPLLLLT